MSIEDTALIVAVMNYAAEAHQNQRRKGSVKRPYINHCIWVSNSIAASGDPHASVDVLCAAILHDIVEDTPTTCADLQARFGASIAALVEEVSDDRSLSRAQRKALQVEHAGALSPGACLIKIADKTSNVRDLYLDPPTAWSVERILAYVDWSETVVAALSYQSAALMESFTRECAHAREAFASTDS